ncbi:hypothetical protein J8273_2083 [Carpediemonas membranifera]|uniref:Uncharacterized protein n=1 Tax=Carpediemonas membranifera TaxID=201153 RepID=A0A8J6E5V3_9EUKA|nr:hypothetical protein J8273_2083 [Carpediemonas membranifera]|eukprot:KAG9396352.1 hypothetical protein J8273_2083 [Carpediemonas membranifera]
MSSIFQQRLEQHASKAKALHSTTESLGMAALKNVDQYAKELVGETNKDINTLFSNQRQIQQLVKQIQARHMAINKQSQTFLSLIESFNTSVAELGDVKSFIHTTHANMCAVADNLKFIESNM